MMKAIHKNPGHSASRRAAHAVAGHPVSAQCAHTRPLQPCRATATSAPVVTTSARPLAQVPTSLAEVQAIADKFNTGFQRSLFKEYSYRVKQVEGQIPAGLKGTLLRDGPGLFEVGGKKLAHPFDGDGMVASLSFDGEGNVWFRNKYVRTAGFVAEQKAGAQLYRSAFNKGAPEGKMFRINLGPLGELKLSNPFDILSVKDNANTMVIHWGGKILAMNEAGLPHRLTNELETVGVDKLDGAVTTSNTAAHCRVIVEGDGSRRLVMFSSSPAGSDSDLVFWEYDEQFNLLHKASAKIPEGAWGFYHDIAVTEHYYILMQNPVAMNFPKLLTETLTGKSALAECIEFQRHQPAVVHLVARPGKGLPAGELKSYPIVGQAFFTFHFNNAFEMEAGRYLVVDTCSSDKIDFSVNTETLSEAYWKDLTLRMQPNRVIIDLQAPLGPTAVTRYVVLRQGTEFPSVAPSHLGRPTTHSYLVASPIKDASFWGPNQAVLKLSVSPDNGVGRPFDAGAVTTDMWMPPSPHMFPGEPIFVPRTPSGAGHASAQAEDDGWILTWVFDADTVTSHLAILDAQQLSKGPVAKVYLDGHHIPAGLHGMWTPEYLGPAPGTLDSEPHDIRNGV